MRKKEPVRQSVAVSLVLLAALFALPLGVIVPFRSELAPQDASLQTEEAASGGQLDAETVLRVLNGETVEEMDLGTYLVGVVRAEIPASFPEEALKAQAVAARTYTIYKIQSGGNHGDTADICTDSTCCQAWIARDRAMENWGADAEAYEARVEAAVRDTDGETILYGGVPILAVFHSSSAGMTRAAGDVWVSDLPYLQAVDSPEPEDSIPNYYSRVTFTASELRQAILAACPEADLSGAAETWFSDAVTDEAGSVETVTVGGVTVKGTQVRTMLGLRSACFEWEPEGDGRQADLTLELLAQAQVRRAGTVWPSMSPAMATA